MNDKEAAKAEAFKKMLALLEPLSKEQRKNVIHAAAVFYEISMPEDAASVAFWSR